MSEVWKIARVRFSGVHTPEISGDILKFESTHAISGYTPGCDQSNYCSTYPGTYLSMTAATSGYLGTYPEYDQKQLLNRCEYDQNNY